MGVCVSHRLSLVLSHKLRLRRHWDNLDNWDMGMDIEGPNQLGTGVDGLAARLKQYKMGMEMYNWMKPQY